MMTDYFSPFLDLFNFSLRVLEYFNFAILKFLVQGWRYKGFAISVP